MIIYIASGISRVEDYTQRFSKAEKKLTKEGHVALNPAKLPKRMANGKYMPICLAMLEQTDAIYMLEEWEESEGARIERQYAEYRGKWIYHE